MGLIKSVRPSATFDIETEGWDRFVCGAIHHKGESLRYRWREETDMARDLLDLSGNVYAHNGGRFDFLWLIRTIVKHRLLPRGVSMEVVESGSSIIMIRLRRKGDDLVFRDSFAMFPLSLRKLGVKDEVGLDCVYLHDECERSARFQKAAGLPVKGCGGYCAISRSLPPAMMARLIDYCVSDCVNLHEALVRMIDFAEQEAGLTLGATVGSTSWKSVIARGLLAPTSHNHRTWDACKAGYYGGRVSLFKHRAEVIHRYDITSSYPHQSSQPLPDGEPISLWTSKDARKAYDKDRPGIYDAKVIVPPMYVPPLPVRAKERNAYPIGEFCGSWALPHLQYAESLGCRIEPLGATVFPRLTTSLADFMSELISLRLKQGKDSPEGSLLKLWANSIYGKMGQSAPTRRMMIGNSEDIPEGSIPLEPSHLIWTVPLRTGAPIPPCGHVEKAAYITARGQVMHHKQLIARGEDAVYGDTDSCYSLQTRSAKDGVRAGLGGWDYEGIGKNFVGLAPKVYTYDTPKGPKIRAKGIPLVPMAEADTREIWESLSRGAPYRNRIGISSLRQSLRSGLSPFTRKDATRRLSGRVSFGDRIPDGPNDSRPPRVKEVEI